MIRDLALADDVLDARELVGKDRRDQVLGVHARELRRHLLAADEARQRERHAGNPAPARDEHGRIEQGLDQHGADRGRMQVARHLGELEAVRRGQRQHDRVLGRRGLQLEIELAAEALAQRQAPGPVDAAAIGRVDDQLHAADRVEEALEHDPVLGRQAAQRRVRRGQIVDQLGGGRLVQPDLLPQPAQRAAPVRFGHQVRGELRPQAGDRNRQLVAAPGRLAQPERNGRRHAVRVLHPDGAALDAQDAVRIVAQLEHVAGHALDREVLIHGADELVLGLEQSPGSRRCPGWCRPRSAR